MRASETPLGSHAPPVEPPHETSHRPREPALPDTPGQPWTFDSVYQSYAPFVWRNALRLGVPTSAAEDVMQEVFLVVHRRLPEFEERTSVRAWLSAILIRVVRAHRRTQRRKRLSFAPAVPLEPDRLTDAKTPSPLDWAERDEAVRELYGVLSRMNEERREVLILSEIEELSAPEIADALSVNVNTVYWRLRAARKEFERIVLRRRASEGTGAR